MSEKIDLRPWGYAPGNYMCICSMPECKSDDGFRNQRLGTFIGDKYSARCETCALDARKKSIAEEALIKTKLRTPQLTRDSLPPRHDRETCIPVSEALTVALLVAKLHSETEEIANDLRSIEEYGDLFTTLMALAKLNGISESQIFVAARKKKEAKGDLVAGNFWIPIEFMEKKDGE